MKAGCRLLNRFWPKQGGIDGNTPQMLADICRISQSQDSHFPHISGQMTGQVADWLARWPASYRYRGSDSINRPA